MRLANNQFFFFVKNDEHFLFILVFRFELACVREREIADFLLGRSRAFCGQLMAATAVYGKKKKKRMKKKIYLFCSFVLTFRARPCICGYRSRRYVDHLTFTYTVF